MRILHSADWHLGRSLHGVDLLSAQAAYLDHLVELARVERPDALIVAGDIFDRAVPPVEAIRLLDDALFRLAERTTVIVISGNHDSAARLGFGSRMWVDRVHLVTDLARVGEPIAVGDGLVFPIPFLDPDIARVSLAPATGDFEQDRPLLARSHAAVIGAAMDRIRASCRAREAAGTPTGPIVVAAHAFVVGGEPSSSERDIAVGGVDAVPAGLFAGIDAVALGHLHRPQSVGEDRINYAGSPLAFSFSEVGQVKSTSILTVTRSNAPVERVTVERVAAPVPRPLADISGSMDRVLAQAAEFSQCWLRVRITDAVRPAHMHERLRDTFPHLLVALHEPAGVSTAEPARRITAEHDPVQVATEFVEYVTGAAASPAQRAELASAYDAVLAAGRETA